MQTTHACLEPQHQLELHTLTEDPLAAELNDITDVELKLPGVVSGIREWFRWYKTPDDKAPNKFAYKEKAFGQAEALKARVHHGASHMPVSAFCYALRSVSGDPEVPRIMEEAVGWWVEAWPQVGAWALVLAGEDLCHDQARRSEARRPGRGPRESRSEEWHGGTLIQFMHVLGAGYAQNCPVRLEDPSQGAAPANI